MLRASHQPGGASWAINRWPIFRSRVSPPVGVQRQAAGCRRSSCCWRRSRRGKPWCGFSPFPPSSFPPRRRSRSRSWHNGQRWCRRHWWRREKSCSGSLSPSWLASPLHWSSYASTGWGGRSIRWWCCSRTCPRWRWRRSSSSGSAMGSRPRSAWSWSSPSFRWHCRCWRACNRSIARCCRWWIRSVPARPRSCSGSAFRIRCRTWWPEPR